MIKIRRKYFALAIVAMSFLWLLPLLYRPWNRLRLPEVLGFALTLSYGVFQWLRSKQRPQPQDCLTPEEISARIEQLTQMLVVERPDRAELLHQRAMLRIAREEWEAAIDDFSEALDDNAKNRRGAHQKVEAYHYRGTALVRLERFEEAKRDLSIAIATLTAFQEAGISAFQKAGISVEIGETLVERADCYLAEGDKELAEKDLRRAIPLLNGEYCVSSRMLFATILEGRGQWQEALEQCDLVLQQVSTSASILTADKLMVTNSVQMTRGRTLLAIDRFEDAVAAFDEVISAMSAAEELDENLKNARLMRAEALLQCGELAKAALDVDLVMEASPGDSHARVLRAMVAAENQQFQVAMDELQEVLKSEPDHLQALLNYAILLTGAHDDSLRDGTRALQVAEKLGSRLGINYWIVLSIQAAAHAELGSFSTAVQLAEQSLEAAPQEEKAGRSRRLDQFRQQRPFRCEPMMTYRRLTERSQ